MARIAKDGLEYFPLDVTFWNDIKVRRVMRKHGTGGAAIIIALYSAIYNDHGYFLPIDEDTIFQLSEQCMCGESEIKDVLETALAVNLFDWDVYEKEGVITSRRIQKQWLDIVQKSNRANTTINPKFAIKSDLMPIKSDGIAIKSDLMPIKSDLMPQSKVKESKEKNRVSKLTLVGQARPDAPEDENESEPDYPQECSALEEIICHLNERTGKNFSAKTKTTARAINARLAEGYTVEDFKAVIDKKCVEWMNTDYENYLRPQTLFSPGHFESYLNQRGSPRRQSATDTLMQIATGGANEQAGNRTSFGFLEGGIPWEISECDTRGNGANRSSMAENSC